jgi:hypothetical protein
MALVEMVGSYRVARWSQLLGGRTCYIC